MQFDWLTIAAQIANFLILIWLLQRFLYKPITSAMARREQRIEERLSDARKAKESAEQEAKALRDKQQELEDSKNAVLQKTRQEAEDLHKRLEAEVREEIKLKRIAWLEHLEDSHDETQQLLEKKVAQHIVDVVRRILSDFADTELAGQIATEFIRRIEALGKEERTRLAETAKSSHEVAVVESGFELPPVVRGRITRAVHDCLADEIEIQYRIDRDLLVGVRLTLAGQTVEWSAGRHLDRLADLFREVLDPNEEEAVGQ